MLLLSSKEDIIEALQRIAKISTTEEEEIMNDVLPARIGINQLLIVAKMAKESSSDIVASDTTTFSECLHVARFYVFF